MLSRRFAVLAGLALTFGVAAASDCQARTVYDGSWAVEVTGRTDACMGSLRYTLQIWNGKISYGGSDASVTGHVTPAGAVSVRIVTGMGQAGIGSGRLSRNYGSGTFRGQASSGVCAGTWAGQRVS